MGRIIKILNGAQSGQMDLCPTCRYASIWIDARGEHRLCQSSTRMTPRGKVSQCSDYTDRREPHISDLRAIAWELRTDKKGKAVGFAAPDAKKARSQPWEEDV